MAASYRTDFALHLDGFECEELARIERHRVAVGVVGGGAAFFRHLAGILGELALSLGECTLLLRRSFDPLALDRIRGIGLADRDIDQFDRQLLERDVLRETRLDFGIDLLDGCGLNRRLVHAMLLDCLTDTRREFHLDIAGVPLLAELLDELHGVRDTQTNHCMEVERHAVRRHEIVEFEIELHRLHVHDGFVCGVGHPHLTRLHRSGIHAAVAEEHGLHEQHRLLAGADLDAVAAESTEHEQAEKQEIENGTLH